MVNAVKDMISSVTHLLNLLKYSQFNYDSDDNETDNEIVMNEANVINDEKDLEREFKKTRTDMDKDDLTKNPMTNLNENSNVLSINIKEQENNKNYRKTIEDNFVITCFNESNDENIQSILEANILNKAESPLARPKTLELKITNNISTTENMFGTSKTENEINITAKSIENNDVIMNEDVVTNEIDLTVEMDEKIVNNKVETDLLNTENIEDKMQVNNHNEEFDNTNKRSVAEQDALDLFMSFYDKEQAASEITDKNNENIRNNHIIESSNNAAGYMINKENVKNEEGYENLIKNVSVNIQNEPEKMEILSKSEDVSYEMAVINSDKKEFTTNCQNEIVEIEEITINPIKAPEEKKNEETSANESTFLQNEVINTSNISKESFQVSIDENQDTNKKRTTRHQNKSVIFKPIANRKALREEVNNVSVLDISEVKLDDEKLMPKPKGRGKKVKTEKTDTDVLPTQTQSDGKNPKKIKKNDKGETKLHVAAMNGEYDLCKNLLEQGMDPNIKDYAGWTPLHEACGNGHLDIASLLVENNADINIKGFKDSTPLHEAILNNHMDCAKYLLSKNPDINIRNSHGFLAKDFLKNNKNNSELIKLFEKVESNIKSSGLITNAITSTQSNIIGKSRGKRSSNTKSKPVVVYSTGMTEDEKLKLAESAKKLNFKFVREMSSSVTHVVFKDTQNNKTCQRTINYMKAILMGLWIVSIKWIEDSLTNGSLLGENEYEAKGSHKIHDSNAPFKGRMNASYENPNLFEDYYFYFYGDFKVFEKNDLINLVKLGGGKMVRREPKLDRLDELITKTPFHADKNLKCTHFIIYDTTKPRETIRNTYLNTMNVNWIFDCIDYFSIKLIENTKY